MSVPVQESLLDMGDAPVPGMLRPERTPLARGAWIDVQRGWLTGAGELFTRLAERIPWRAERRRMYDRTVDVPRLLCFYREGEELPDPVLTACRDLLSARYRAELGEPFATAGLCLYRDGRDSVAWHGDTIGRGAREDTMIAILSLGEGRPLLLRPRPGTQNASGHDAGRHNTGTHNTGGQKSGRRDTALHNAGRENADRPNTGRHNTGRTNTGGDGRTGTLRYNLGHGDLLVMGGSCQRTWEHAVPKSARPTGPRISVQFRPRGVR